MSYSFEATEAWAVQRDADDALASYREAFSLPVGADGRALAYLCGNSLGLMPRQVPARMAEELDAWARMGVEGHHDAVRPWLSYHENFRETGARLVGARSGEVVFMNSLTVNLHLMMVSFFRPQGRRRKILIEESAFPSDTYAVATHLATRGIDPADGMMVLGPEPGEHLIRTDAIERVLRDHGDEIALVLWPGVQYYTGQLFDIRRITEAAHRAGAAAGFDLAHTVGNVPLQLHDWNVDFAAWCSYKYLNAGPGAVGGCFVHERHGRDLSIGRYAGWWGNDPSTRFRMHLNSAFEPQPGAEGWQISNPQIFSMTPLLASLELFDSVGTAALRTKSLELTAYLEYLVDRIPGGRIEQITPRDPAARGAQMSLLVREGAREAFDAARARGLVPDFRQPDVIRMAPVPFYNSFHDVWRTGHVLAEVLGA